MPTVSFEWYGQQAFVRVDPAVGNPDSYDGTAWIGKPPRLRFMDDSGRRLWLIQANSAGAAAEILLERIRAGMLTLES